VAATAGLEYYSSVFAIIYGECVLLWFGLLVRLIVVQMFGRTLALCFVLLALQGSARLQTKRLTEDRTLTDRSWSNVLQEVEGTLRKDCGDECIEVLHAYFPPGSIAPNMTGNEMLNSSFQTVSKQIALQVLSRQCKEFEWLVCLGFCAYQVQAAKEAPHAMNQSLHMYAQGSQAEATGTTVLGKDVPCSSKAACKSVTSNDIVSLVETAQLIEFAARIKEAVANRYGRIV
jgi:hypothetical protein